MKYCEWPSWPAWCRLRRSGRRRRRQPNECPEHYRTTYIAVLYTDTYLFGLGGPTADEYITRTFPRGASVAS
ncbi:hypothetical protein EVAR_6268_1 [Eumeta japonica]|uniref:Uncharacterized protein n=1 Tax=Eumeta variegata TaxID=151549 RepID=A0A4C1T9A0_EUMVA|nr:hypothetical protein EVAR_6268_1 [Eumeta japonica]